MKLAIIVRVLWPGGVQRVAVKQAIHLHRLGIPVKLVFIRRSHIHRVFYDLSGTDYIVLNERSPFKRVFKAITYFYAKERGPEASIELDSIIKAVMRFKDYVLLLHDQFTGIGGLFLKSMEDKDYFVYIHESDIAKYICNKNVSTKYIPVLALEKAVVKNARHVFTNSKRNAIGLKTVNPNITVLYQGCDLKFRPNMLKERRDYVLSVAMWDKGRRPEILLEIAKKLRKGKIIIAGSWTDPTYMAQIYRSIKRSGLSNVIVTGSLSDYVLNHLYEISKIFVRFSFYDYGEYGLGQGILEALGYGLPIITNSNLGATEIIKNNLHGYVLDKVEPDAVASIIDELLTNTKLYTEFANNVIELAKKLSWDNHARKLVKVLKQLNLLL